jgi:membrane-associated phospholipid phosphatase
MLGEVDPHHEGAEPYVQRISARGWEVLDIHAASSLLKLGQAKANLVAAIPSLHAGLTMFLALFMWPRVRALGRTLFLGYALAMAFTLVYTAEHYVFDIVLGWGLAALVIVIVNVVDRRMLARRIRPQAPETVSL